MYAPSPNEQDFLLWAAQRIDAGDVELTDYYEGYDYIDVAPWTTQCLLDGMQLFGDDSELQFEDIVLQFRVRAGVETRPWELIDTPESDEWSSQIVDEYDEYGDDYDNEHDYGDEQDEPDHDVRVVLPVSTENYTPSTSAEGAAFVDGRAYVVWGDWLFEACEGGELRGVVELPSRCELYCAIDSLLVLQIDLDFLLYDLAGGAFVRRDVDVPVFRDEQGPEARSLLPDSEWVSLPVCVEARIANVSPDGRMIRIKDRLGKGGVLRAGSWRRVGNAGGPYRDQRPSRQGPKLGGAMMETSDWRELVKRLRSRTNPMRRTSAFAWHEGRCRFTDNGLTFFEDHELILVLDEPARRVTFRADGREILVATDDTLLRIDLDANAIVDSWRQPARLRYLRSVLPPYQPDEYIEQVVALWEVLADPNERSDEALNSPFDFHLTELPKK